VALALLDSQYMRRHTTHFPQLEMTVQPLGHSINTPEDARAALQKIMDDCPDCRAARARGEEPVIVEGPFSMTASLPAADRPQRRAIFARRPRWRTMKRLSRR
jgi:hypothetical protein